MGVRWERGPGGEGLNILLIRTSALGDVVHCLPVLTALRRHFSGGEDRMGRRRGPWRRCSTDIRTSTSGSSSACAPGGKQPFSRRTIREVGRVLASAWTASPPTSTLDLMGNHKAGVLSALTLCDRRIGAGRGAPARAVERGLDQRGRWRSRGDHAVDRCPLLARRARPRRQSRPISARSKLLRGNSRRRAQRWLRRASGAVRPHPSRRRLGEQALSAANGGARWRGGCSEATGLPDLGTGRRRATRAGGRSGDRERRRGADACRPGSARPGGAASAGARLVLGGDSGPTHLARRAGRFGRDAHGTDRPGAARPVWRAREGVSGSGCRAASATAASRRRRPACWKSRLIVWRSGRSSC